MSDPATFRARRDAAVHAWSDVRGHVVIPAGLHVPIAGTDQFHEFHAHNEHRYLAGAAVAGGVLTFDPGEGWSLFAPVPTPEDRVWSGDGVPLDELRTVTGIDRVHPMDRLAPWLEGRRGDHLALLGNPDLRDHPRGYGIENLAGLEPAFDDDLAARLSEQVSELRRTKDATEIALMRRAAEATRRGHMAAFRLARDGMTERELQVEIEAEFFRAGAQRTAYGSIVGTGSNGAVLHFAPTDRPLRTGEIVLVDAGAEVDGYASDVTRTFPAGARFEGLHRYLYALVYDVQTEAIRDARPGKEYRDLHMEAALRIAEGLVDATVLRGSPESLVERDAHALFFPHGLGHMLGLATHDAGGCLAGRTPSDRFGLKHLRADLPLQPGYVVTIEPGIYFVRALLEDPEIRARYRDAVAWDRVDGLLDFGGIRIEDDVLITDGEADVLSRAIPKKIDEIDALRGEAAGR